MFVVSFFYVATTPLCFAYMKHNTFPLAQCAYALHNAIPLIHNTR